MTSIYDIPHKDIVEFLLANNKNFEDENDAYNKSLELLKDKKTVGHNTSIIEWMIAYNLLIKQAYIPNYTTYEINKLSQNEINQLAKKLGMKSNNIENIKNILRYLHKLDNKNILILPEIDDIILQNLEKLEIEGINFDYLKFNDIINLLKIHNNKALIRKLIYDNMEKVIFYNLLSMNVEKLGDLTYYFDKLSYNLPKSVVLELVRINQKNLLKNNTEKEINDLIDYLEKMRMGYYNLNIYDKIEDLRDFLITLIKIDEIGLAKKVLDITNQHKFRGQIDRKGYSFNRFLLQGMAGQKDEGYNVLLKIMM